MDRTKISLATLGLALALPLLPARAEAGGGGHGAFPHGGAFHRGGGASPHHFHRRGGFFPPSHGRYGGGHGAFVVPRVLHRHGAPSYRHYFHGRFYYAPHRHHHAVYAFPVVLGHRPVYRPYAYCGGRLFAAGHFTPYGPRFHLGFHFGF